MLTYESRLIGKAEETISNISVVCQVGNIAGLEDGEIEGEVEDGEIRPTG